jgi:hypothetical protein
VAGIFIVPAEKAQDVRWEEVMGRTVCNFANFGRIKSRDWT